MGGDLRRMGERTESKKTTVSGRHRPKSGERLVVAWISMDNHKRSHVFQAVCNIQLFSLAILLVCVWARERARGGVSGAHTNVLWSLTIYQHFCFNSVSHQMQLLFVVAYAFTILQVHCITRGDRKASGMRTHTHSDTQNAGKRQRCYLKDMQKLSSRRINGSWFWYWMDLMEAADSLLEERKWICVYVNWGLTETRYFIVWWIWTTHDHFCTVFSWEAR